MRRQTIALIALVLLAGLAGCVGGDTSPEEKSQDLQTNETYTFTKPAAGADGYWTCIAWDKYGGSGDDNQMQCHYVEEA